MAGTIAGGLDDGDIRELREGLADQVPDQMNGSPFSPDPERTALVLRRLEALMAERGIDTSPESSISVPAVLDELLGLGVLADAFRDPAVATVIVTGHDRLFVERAGRMYRLDASFRDAEHLHGFVERISMSEGRQVTEEHPVLDMALADGTRVAIVGPPLTDDGEYLVTIRKALKSQEE